MTIFEARVNGLDIGQYLEGREGNGRLTVEVLPEEYWFQQERRAVIGDVRLALFETPLPQPTTVGVQGEALDLHKRNLSVDLGRLPHLKVHGERSVSIRMRPGCFYDVFGVARTNEHGPEERERYTDEDRGFIAGLLRLGRVGRTVAADAEYCLTLEQAQFIAGTDILLTPAEMRRIPAGVNVAAYHYPDGKTTAGVAFYFGSLGSTPQIPIISGVSLDMAAYGTRYAREGYTKLVIRQENIPTARIRDVIKRPFLAAPMPARR